MNNNGLLDASVLISAFHLSIQGFKFLMQVLQYQKKAEWAQKQPIQNGDEKQMLQKGLGKRVALLKLHCTKSKQHKVQLDVGVLENIYNKFPLDRNISQFLRQCQHMQAADDKWKSKQFTKPLKMGHATERNIFRIKHEYKQDEKSFLQWVYFGFATIGAIIIDVIAKALSFNPHNLYIKGPILGTLITTFQLAMQSPILVQCQINGRQITPKVMGLTKNDIVDYYKDQAFRSKLGLLVIASLLILFRKTISNSIKFYVNLLKRKFDWGFAPISFSKKGKVLDVEVAQELNCIICMVKCRNVVFPKCRHLSICEGCYQSHRQDMSRCPLCRDQVGDEVLFVQELEEIPLRKEE